MKQRLGAKGNCGDRGRFGFGSLRPASPGSARTAPLGGRYSPTPRFGHCRCVGVGRCREDMKYVTYFLDIELEVNIMLHKI